LARRRIATPHRTTKTSFAEKHGHRAETTAESRDAVQRAREFWHTERAILHPLPLPDPENQRTRLACESRGQSGATIRGDHRRLTPNAHADDYGHAGVRW